VLDALGRGGLAGLAGSTWAKTRRPRWLTAVSRLPASPSIVGQIGRVRVLIRSCRTRREKLTFASLEKSTTTTTHRQHAPTYLIGRHPRPRPTVLGHKFYSLAHRRAGKPAAALSPDAPSSPQYPRSHRLHSAVPLISARPSFRSPHRPQQTRRAVPPTNAYRYNRFASTRRAR
jgi:hypothetical protein